MTESDGVGVREGADLGLGDSTGEAPRMAEGAGSRESGANPQPPTETVNLRIPSAELARLDLLLADVRGRAGVFVGRSGVVRALVNWLSEVNLGLRGIRTGADLERRLLRLVSRESSERPQRPGVDTESLDDAGGGSRS